MCYGVPFPAPRRGGNPAMLFEEFRKVIQVVVADALGHIGHGEADVPEQVARVGHSLPEVTRIGQPWEPNGCP